MLRPKAAALAAVPTDHPCPLDNLYLVKQDQILVADFVVELGRSEFKNILRLKYFF